MAITITLTEKENKLEIQQPYPRIVCGNSEYVLHFELSSEWQDCDLKTAIFMLQGKTKNVLFSGEDCKVPILPNAPFVMVSLCSADNLGKQHFTSPIRLELAPSAYGECFSELEDSQTFVSDVMGVANAIKNGNLTVDYARHATSADSATEADHAGSADSANTATHAGRADSAAEADHAANSNHATEADHTQNADHATESDTANHATTAESADSATTAKNADNATNAESANMAKRAESATNATMADSANNAAFAKSADFADVATRADAATYATSAGYSETQVDLTSNQDIAGAKNFTGTLTVNGKPVLTDTNHSNPNYLINPGFLINLRGKQSYTGKTYTVDRWINRDTSSVVTPLDGGGIKFEKVAVNEDMSVSMISQSIENFNFMLGRTVTLTVKLRGNTTESGIGLQLCCADTSYYDTTNLGCKYFLSDGIFSMTTTLPTSLEHPCLNAVIRFTTSERVGASVIIDWAKLEIGSKATEYQPRLYAEDLNLCQRYFVHVEGQIPAVTTFSGKYLYPEVYLPCALRTSPTLLNINPFSLRGNGLQFENVSNVKVNVYYVNTNCLMLTLTCNELTGNLVPYSCHNGGMNLDAEIY